MVTDLFSFQATSNLQILIREFFKTVVPFKTIITASWNTQIFSNTTKRPASDVKAPVIAKTSRPIRNNNFGARRRR